MEDLASSSDSALFFSMDALQYVGLASILFTTTICQAGGIGGGVFIVPILLFLFPFSASTAVALAQVSICGGSFVKFMLQVKEKQYMSTEPVINYASAVLIAPGLMIGLQIGVMFNLASPRWVIVIMLILLLVLCVYRTYAKYKILQGLAQESGDAGDQLEQPLYHSITESFSPASIVRASFSPASFDSGGMPPPGIWSKTQLQKLSRPPSMQHSQCISEAEEQDLPFAHVQYINEKLHPRTFQKQKIGTVGVYLALIVSIMLLNLSYSVLAGSKGVESWLGIENMCVPEYWNLFAVFSICMVVTHCLAVTVTDCLEKATRINKPQGEVPGSGGISVQKKYFLVPVAGLATGFACSWLGIGGGIVMVPLFLELQLAPESATATSTLMISVSTFTSSVLFSMQGVVPLSYGLFLLFGNMVASGLGWVKIRAYLTRTGNFDSLLVLVSVLLVCAVPGVAGGGIREMLLNLNNPAFWSFQSLC